MGFFIFLKNHKSSSAFANFCYSSYKDNFYIPIPAKSLKVGPNKLNALKKITPKSSLYKSKDRQRSKVSEGVDTGNNGFKDLNS